MDDRFDRILTAVEHQQDRQGEELKEEIRDVRERVERLEADRPPAA